MEPGRSSDSRTCPTANWNVVPGHASAARESPGPGLGHATDPVETPTALARRSSFVWDTEGDSSGPVRKSKVLDLALARAPGAGGDRSPLSLCPWGEKDAERCRPGLESCSLTGTNVTVSAAQSIISDS